MTDLPDKSPLRPGEVAIYLSISVKTVYGWIAEGKLDAVKVGPSQSIRITREAVKNIIQPAIQ